MAILGRYIDRQTVSRVGDALFGTTLATLPHSLPATTAELFICQLQSAADIGTNSAVSLLALGSNQSLLTVGYRVSSSASTPTFSYVVLAGVLHSVIR